MLRVVIIGYGEMFANLIAGTLDSGAEIVGVLRQETIKYPCLLRWLKDIFNPSKDFNYIKSYNLPEIYARGVNTEVFRKKILKLRPDIILVGSWGEKFQKSTFNIPKIATINAHPSLLPKYRGPNPYFWVLRNQEQESGITFHLVDEKFDTGAILAQEEVKIYPSDTGKTLKERTVLVARSVVCDLLKNLNEDIIIPLQQRESAATYFSYPDNLELDFRASAEENFALIRACYPWYEPYFYHKLTALIPNPKKISIEENQTKFTEYGTVVECDSKSKTIAVLCGDNKVLKMSDVSLYKKQDRFFTKNYISLEINEGDFLQ